MVEVCLRGRPGHGSVPRAADNALVRASEAVQRIARYEAPTVITPGKCNITVREDTVEPNVVGVFVKPCFGDDIFGTERIVIHEQVVPD